MDCKTTSQFNRGYSLVEMLTATAVASLVFVAVGHMSFYGSRSFAKVATTVETDQQVRFTLERISDDVRRSTGIAHYSSKKLVMDVHGVPVSYEFLANANMLVRREGTNSIERILTHCTDFNFKLYQRRPPGKSFDLIAATYPGEGKVLQVEWNCSRNLPSLGKQFNTTKSARVVIREG